MGSSQLPTHLTGMCHSLRLPLCGPPLTAPGRIGPHTQSHSTRSRSTRSPTTGHPVSQHPVSSSTRPVTRSQRTRSHSTRSHPAPGPACQRRPTEQPACKGGGNKAVGPTRTEQPAYNGPWDRSAGACVAQACVWHKARCDTPSFALEACVAHCLSHSSAAVWHEPVWHAPAWAHAQVMLTNGGTSLCGRSEYRTR